MASMLPLLCCLLILLYSGTTALSVADVNETETDRQSLLCFKSGIYSDPLGLLSAWHNTSLNFCSWAGISCSTRLPTRVVSLNLTSGLLGGKISGCIANLTSLSQMVLTGNSLSGAIPDELGMLPGLRTLMLAGNHLEGNIPGSLGSSMSLSSVDLANNSLSGRVPGSLASSSSLSAIILSRNNLTGEIPATLFANSSMLIKVDLQQNSLTGVIPPFGKVANLEYLCVTENFLSGSIPPSIGNISSLHSIRLGQNKFTGPIPESLGHIPKPFDLDLSFNILSGHVPLSLYNMSSLNYFSLGSNGLVGKLPYYIGYSLPNLRVLSIQSNNMEGQIPTSIQNVSNLQVLDLSNNSLHGCIPSLGSLANLQQVLLGRNRLEGHDWIFFDSLTNCSRLEKLWLEENMLKGSLPRLVCNLSTSLDSLRLGSNQISGSIPVEISNLVNLTELSMESNLLWGSIPATVGKMQKLFILDLSKNKLSGEIPSTVGNIIDLGKLFLDDNNLRGNIPGSLGRCLGLFQLNLSANNLNGLIPGELFLDGPPLPLSMDFSHNNLIGEVPMFCGATGIVLLNVSNNLLSGELPEHFAGCFELLSLSMEGNKLQGNIPASFDGLRSIRYINLSRNDLSGNVPEFFENFTMLDQLDLSYNNFEGPIPTRGIFAKSTMVHLDGNKRLCSNFSKLELPPCPDTKTKTKNHVPFAILKLLVPIYTVAFLLLLVCLFLLWRKMVEYIVTLHRKIWYLLKLVTHWCMRQVCMFSQLTRRGNVFRFVTHSTREVWNALCFLTLRRSRDVEIFPTYQESLKRVSYGDIVKATEWFSPVHRISATRTGSVYVGRFKFDSDFVAIKVFNLNERGVHESYLTECEVLRSIRHRNILKSVTSCSTLDTENNEFKALVLQFMANGSLERWLHPPKQQTADEPRRTLSLGKRICIITDVASALDYLHNQLIPPLVHCDLKPSNVLLDYDMTARVGDFGSAKFISQDSGGLKCLVSIQGTIGYLAPEYGMGCEITTRGDVYSFGVLLLEMLTGKRPTDEMFVDELNLHRVVDSMFPHRIEEILDPHMMHEEHQLCAEVRMQSYIIPLVAVGLSCSLESPKDRPGMQDVCAKLCAIKEAFLESVINA